MNTWSCGQTIFGTQKWQLELAAVKYSSWKLTVDAKSSSWKTAILFHLFYSTFIQRNLTNEPS